MEIYHLRVFLEVARYLSFTEAADALNLTQPAVSAKIKSLEANLGVDLFHRLGRKIKLTAVGSYLLEAGPSLLALENRLINEINEIKQGKYSRLKIGCTDSIANGWLPKILFKYRQKYPDIQLQCLPFNTVQQLHQAITVGEIEIGFAETNLNGFDEIDSIPIDSFQYFLMVATDHRLAPCQWLSLRDLTSEAWVFPGAGTPDHVALEARLAELDMHLSDFTHREFVQSPSLLNTFLSQGHYLGFGSSLQLQTERQANLLVSIPLQEFALDYQLFMVTPRRLSRVTPRQHRADLQSPAPLQQFIQLVSKESERAQRIRSQKSFSKSAAHLQSPSLWLRQSHGASSETLTLTIGTQNKTIQTVTAGVIIQRLGLLEHFLPRSGQYSKTNYQIKWHDFTSGAPIAAGLQTQQLDIGILGDYPLLLSGLTSGLASENDPSPSTKTRLVSFVASNPDGTGNTIIVPGRSSLSSLDDLRHRVIAVPFASSAHGMVMRTLFQADLLHEVTLNSIDNLSIDRLTPRNDQADGYAYFAPLHEIASHHGKFRRLVDTPDLTKLPTFHGIVVRDSFAEQHPELVVAYLKALIAAQHWYINTPSAPSLVSSWVRLDPEIVSKTLDDQQSNRTGLFFPETQIRMDWITDHIQQLKVIPGNEQLGEIDVKNWIQPELLENAISSF
ncbi:LysR family transcriptional regulator [Leptolyngbya cf. ectocarpi LEGE 11479]|uniref:LysR family transcriptional regulator n=1 Tax=Leptolyngbya cf. ectocarpi LEGE 11479 TaxID=1828722 RepID=A0A929F7N5_LEPEC|nr:LysR substrate-binding domain-containing protein [Leptolyngbya ectocarpi]MBE9068346.1 LysR family transcriptional regulator [Leptolyngbya cf. ectocarpi LEGE 11479]